MNTETEFWKLFATTQEIDPQTGKTESLRRWARRAGIDINVLIGWKRGSIPKVSTLRSVAGTLGKKKDYFAWIAAIGGDVSGAAPVYTVPLYAGRVSAGNAGELVSKPVDTLSIACDVLVTRGVKPESVVALRLSESADSMEPEIPRGSVVFVDITRGRNADTFVNGAPYAVIRDDGDICIKWVVESAQQLWFISANNAYKPKKAWSNDLIQIIAGLVFHQQATPQQINPRSFHPEV